MYSRLLCHMHLERVGGNATYHGSLHTNTYYYNVYNELSGCTSADECISVLRRIASALQNGTFGY